MQKGEVTAHYNTALTHTHTHHTQEEYAQFQRTHTSLGRMRKQNHHHSSFTDTPQTVQPTNQPITFWTNNLNTLVYAEGT